MGARAQSLFPHCANPRCSTGWMRLWRSRRVPSFEGRWACSPECMGELVASALRREMDGGDAVPAPYPHEEHVREALAAGAQGYIRKQFTPDQVRDRVLPLLAPA